MNKFLVVALGATLVSFFPLTHGGVMSYYISYELNDTLVHEVLPERQVTVRIDEEWNSESYDPLSRTVHLSPGRIMGNKGE